MASHEDEHTTRTTISCLVKLRNIYRFASSNVKDLEARRNSSDDEEAKKRLDLEIEKWRRIVNLATYPD